MYDEDGYAAVKRVVERGEDVTSVKPMATIVVNYPVTFIIIRYQIMYNLAARQYFVINRIEPQPQYLAIDVKINI